MNKIHRIILTHEKDGYEIAVLEEKKVNKKIELYATNFRYWCRDKEALLLQLAELIGGKDGL